MSRDSGRVVLVGGGVIGLCAAHFLAAGGREVVVLEREEEGGDNCSQGNAGMVVPSHFVPLAAPGMVTQGLKWMLDAESPFYVRPRPSLDLARWGWLFVRHANAAHVARSATLLRDLQMESRLLFTKLAAEADFGLVQRGLLTLCETEEFLEEEAELAERAGELGLQAEVCDPRRLAELDPGIEMKVAGGIWHAHDCHLHPGRFLKTMADRIRAAGGSLRFGARVREVREREVVLEDGEKVAGDWIVVAGGAWTPELAGSLGIRLPMQGGKGYSMTLEQPGVQPRLCSILAEARVAVTPMDGVLRVAGTMEICGNDRSVNERRVQGIIKSACRVYPQLEAAAFEGVPRWAGLRPCSPDGLPYLGTVPGRERVVVATGHAMLGLSMGPVTGKLVAELVNGGSPSIPLEALAVARFS